MNLRPITIGRGGKNNKRVFWAEDRRFKPYADKRIYLRNSKGAEGSTESFKRSKNKPYRRKHTFKQFKRNGRKNIECKEEIGNLF